MTTQPDPHTPDDRPAVRVARDVLARLDAFEFRTGVYLDRRWPPAGPVAGLAWRPDGSPVLPPEQVDAVTADCQCCLLGACLLSKARTLGVPRAVLVTADGFPDVRGGDVYAQLDDVFGPASCEAMELAFELSVGRLVLVHLDEGARRAAVAFGVRAGVTRPRDRVRAVMHNVIDRGGVFRPPPCGTATYDKLLDHYTRHTDVTDVALLDPFAA